MAADPLFASYEAEIRRLKSALREARDCIESWGTQADAYLQEKHDLAGDIAAIDAILGPEYACPKCGAIASSLWGDCTHKRRGGGLMARVKTYVVPAPDLDELRRAAGALLVRYIKLADSGDCGHWNPREEPEVIDLAVALGVHGVLLGTDGSPDDDAV